MDPERQQAVLDHALRLFSNEEFHGITLDKLSQGCGVEAFDIVRHFQSSENVLRAVLEREMAGIAGVAASATPADDLCVLAAVTLDQYRHRVPLLRRLISESKRDPKIGALVHATFVAQGRAIFAEFLGKRERSGDVEAAAATIVAALAGILLTHELSGGEEDRMLRQMCNIFLRGIIKA